MSTVAALYIDLKGPYPKMDNVDCWDESRDAKKYDGPWPVVAHPPCGPWGRLKFLCTKQDPACGPRAVEQVRAFGGVLEHPCGSGLWKHCGLPQPNQSDAYGTTIEIRQCDFGHVCAKPTMLYMVGVSIWEDPFWAIADSRTRARPTHRVTNGSRGNTSLPRATAKQILHTPPGLARLLVALARSVPSVALAAARKETP